IIVLRITIDKIKPLMNKSGATNLRLSAFICGLNKSQKIWQPDFRLELESIGSFLSIMRSYC
ncbi:MAG: hypothetical protein KKI06_01100, partial [Euryarchaeota archaeon]|nr:hypothetical protein [Euryarchaeota archaeon]